MPYALIYPKKKAKSWQNLSTIVPNSTSNFGNCETCHIILRVSERWLLCKNGIALHWWRDPAIVWRKDTVASQRMDLAMPFRHLKLF